MAACVRAIQQQDGTFLLALDPAATDLTACPYVVETGSGFAGNAYRELGNMTIADAQTIGMSVVAVWAVAWGFRAVAKSISISKESDYE